MYKSLITVSTTIALLICATQIEAQTIQLNNPSFEGLPAASTTPEGWRDCGKPGETPPDTQPNSTFRVFKKAQEGSTYLGLVTRDTDTWEAVGQLLEAPLTGGDCYDFSIHLTRSESYLSRRRMDTIQTQFTQPIRLRVWGGNNYCDKRELLAETDVIDHTTWKKYEFNLKPRREYNFIMLEAFYMTPTLVAYNGNLLLDNCSPIKLTSCNDDETVVTIQEPVKDRNVNIPPKPREKPKKTPKKGTSAEKKDSKKKQTQTKEEPIAKSESKIKQELLKPAERPEETPVEQTEKKKEVDSSSAITKTTPKEEEKEEEQKVITIDELDEIELEEGQIIRVNQLNFPANSSVVTKSNYDVLEEVFNFLNKNSYIIVEIGGHTNGVISHEYSNKLSRERAESVAQYLIDKGIAKERISAKGYGKTQPIDTNETLAGRRKNQRVEVKIISTGR